MNIELALVTEDALQVYEVAKGLARDKKNPVLVALVANMKRDLGRAEAQRKAAAAKKAADKAEAEKAAAEKAAAGKAAAEKAAPPVRAS
jgi:colicin import membrane protein